MYDQRSQLHHHVTPRGFATGRMPMKGIFYLCPRKVYLNSGAALLPIAAVSHKRRIDSDTRGTFERARRVVSTLDPTSKSRLQAALIST